MTKMPSKASLIRQVLEQHGVDISPDNVREYLAKDGRVFSDQDINNQRKLLRNVPISNVYEENVSEENVSEQKKKPRSGKIDIELLRQVKALQDEVGSNYQLKLLIKSMREIGSLDTIESAAEILEELA